MHCWRSIAKLSRAFSTLWTIAAGMGRQTSGTVANQVLSPSDDASDDLDGGDRLDDDETWLWNPFASNAALVNQLTSLLDAKAKDSYVIPVVELLAETFFYGPPRSRLPLNETSGERLIDLFLDNVRNDMMARAAGSALACWIYHNEHANALLTKTHFMDRLDDALPHVKVERHTHHRSHSSELGAWQ